MKKTQLMRAISLFLVLSLLAGCNVNVSSPSANTTEQVQSSDFNGDSEEAVDHSIEEKNVPFYVKDAEHKEEISLYYIDGSEVPYISMDTVLYFLQNMHDDVSYELEYDNEHVIFTRKGT